MKTLIAITLAAAAAALSAVPAMAGTYKQASMLIELQPDKPLTVSISAEGRTIEIPEQVSEQVTTYVPQRLRGRIVMVPRTKTVTKTITKDTVVPGLYLVRVVAGSDLERLGSATAALHPRLTLPGGQTLDANSLNNVHFSEGAEVPIGIVIHPAPADPHEFIVWLMSGTQYRKAMADATTSCGAPTLESDASVGVLLPALGDVSFDVVADGEVLVEVWEVPESVTSN